MEKIELTLPKDGRQVTEEFGVYFLYLLLRFLSSYLQHELVDVTAYFMSIGPLLHLEGEFKLLFSQFENLGNLIFFIELDWVRNFTSRFWSFIKLNDLVEM